MIIFASWLLGEPIPLTKIEPSELSVEPIRADSVIFMKSSDSILHIEFQTRKDKSDVVGVTAIIAGLLLDIETVHRILGREIVEESVVYQEALLKGETRGRAKGIAEGEARNKRVTAINMLHGNISIDQIVQFTGLSVEEIERLR